MHSTLDKVKVDLDAKASLVNAYCSSLLVSLVNTALGASQLTNNRTSNSADNTYYLTLSS